MDKELKCIIEDIAALTDDPEMAEYMAEKAYERYLRQEAEDSLAAIIANYSNHELEIGYRIVKGNKLPVGYDAVGVYENEMEARGIEYKKH